MFNNRDWKSLSYEYVKETFDNSLIRPYSQPYCVFQESDTAKFLIIDDSMKMCYGTDYISRQTLPNILHSPNYNLIDNYVYVLGKTDEFLKSQIKFSELLHGANFKKKNNKYVCVIDVQDILDFIRISTDNKTIKVESTKFNMCCHKVFAFNQTDNLDFNSIVAKYSNGKLKISINLKKIE